ncbi:MAG TPA: hypothetical protein VJ183_16020 [Chloroflexia bacterium]|nr:hypothetical protein [Chloroflexia bacterium]
MEAVRASVMWDGPKSDIVTLFVEPTPEPWQADPDDEFEIVLLRVLDENEEETDEIAGIEIIDFLEFNRWDDLPKVSFLWQLPGWEPLPADELLKRVQHDFKVEAALLARHAG